MIYSIAFVPDYSVRAVSDVFYLTIKRALYLAAKRATLMEKSKRIGSDEPIDYEVEKVAIIFTLLTCSSIFIFQK